MNAHLLEGFLRGPSFGFFVVLLSQVFFCTGKGGGQAASGTSSALVSVSPIGTELARSAVVHSSTERSAATSVDSPSTPSSVASNSSSGIPASSGIPDGGMPLPVAVGSSASEPCASPSLVWHSARKTTYTSYPDPGSEECVKYNGCTWAGEFAACGSKRSEAWVKAHNIAAAFPDFKTLRLHDLCLRKGPKTLMVTVLDTCADTDCDGCCTENRGSSEQLIDLESYTDQRWGVPDGSIEWADLGPTTGPGCSD
jgi:hypothetical protein